MNPVASTANTSRVSETVRACAALTDDFLAKQPQKQAVPVMTKDEIALLFNVRVPGRKMLVAITHEGEATERGKGYIRQRPYVASAQAAQDARADHREIATMFRKLEQP